MDIALRVAPNVETRAAYATQQRFDPPRSYAGYLASTAKNEAFNADALGYARKAIQAIESGKAPTDWEPFKGKDDTLAYLYYTVGFLSLKSAPDQAIEPLIKATQFETDLKKAPSTYYFLAIAYESGPYKAMSAEYQRL